MRKANLGDLVDLLPMARDFHEGFELSAALGDLGEWNANAMAAFLIDSIMDPNSLVIIDESGFAVAVLNRAYWNQEVVVCAERMLWVQPECRGQGIARDLLAMIEEWGRKNEAIAMSVGFEREGYSPAEQVYIRRL